MQRAPVGERRHEEPEDVFELGVFVKNLAQDGADLRQSLPLRGCLAVASMGALEPDEHADHDDQHRDRQSGHCAGYFTWRPPSTRRVSPVMKSLSINASTALAISRPPPHRPTGVMSATFWCSSSVVSGGARIGPGAMALTRMLSGASSSASASVSAMTPPFAT